MLRITPALKRKLRKPIGRLYRSGQSKALVVTLENRFLIAVGDATVLKLARLGITPHISVYDLKTRRESISRNDETFFSKLHAEKIVCVNPAGYITPSMEAAVQNCLRASGSTKLFVIGEEDLAALLFLMHAKSGVVAYGQPREGLVVVEVNPLTRKAAQKLYREFHRVKISRSRYSERQ